MLGEHSGYLGLPIRNQLLNGKYSTLKAMQCTAELPGGWQSFALGSTLWAGLTGPEPWYHYNGPTAVGRFVDSFSMNSGLRWRSQYYRDPSGGPYNKAAHFWGVSVNNKWMRLMGMCPSIVVWGTDPNFCAEPHDGHAPLRTHHPTAAGRRVAPEQRELGEVPAERAVERRTCRMVEAGPRAGPARRLSIEKHMADLSSSSHDGVGILRVPFLAGCVPTAQRPAFFMCLK